MRTRLPQLHLGLKTKSVLTISFLILVTSVILSVFLIERQSSMIQMELEKRGKSMVRNLAHNAEYGVLVENEALLLNLMEGLCQEAEVIYINVWDRTGEILAEWDRGAEFHQVHSKLRPDDAPHPSTLPSRWNRWPGWTSHAHSRNPRPRSPAVHHASPPGSRSGPPLLRETGRSCGRRPRSARIRQAPL